MALRLLHENGYSLDNRMCWIAALGGRLDVLRFLHENGFS
jgi:hypothetical protein